MESFLPATFHSKNSFKNVIKIITDALENPAVVEKTIDAPLLLFGLAYREVSRSIEVEPDAPTSAPVHLVKSTLGVKELEQLVTLINGFKFKPS